jgi:hypothetical protein
MSNNYRVTVGSNSEFEDLVANIEVGDFYFGIISQDEGSDKLKMHIPLGISVPINIPYKEMPTITLSDLEEALKKAKERLWELRRTNPNITGANR